MNIKYNVVYPRDYRQRDGAPVQTQWIQCGVAWQNERGLDVKLWVVPPATYDPVSGMCVRFKLREPAADEAAEGAREAPRRRPEHRDGLDPQGQLRGVPNGRSEPRE